MRVAARTSRDDITMRSAMLDMARTWTTLTTHALTEISQLASFWMRVRSRNIDLVRYKARDTGAKLEQNLRGEKLSH